MNVPTPASRRVRLRRINFVDGDEQNDMSEAEPQLAVPKPSIRWYHLAPVRFVIGLLVVVALWAILCSWIGPRIQKAIQESQRASQRSAQYRKAADAIEKVGGEIWSAGHSNGEVSNCVYFRNAGIGDSDLRPLKELGWVYGVDLRRTQITDSGLEFLTELDRLEELYLEGTKVTDEGVKKLRQALPNCKIHWKPPTPPAR